MALLGRRTLASAMVAFGCCLPAASPALSQSYPTRPIMLVVPFAAGGGNDIMARVIAEKMGRTLGQQVVVENRPGAAGTIGTLHVAKSTPDGYVLGLGSSATLAIAPAQYPNAGYNPLTSFSPVGLIATSALVLVTNPLVPARSVQELIAYAKREPGRLTYGSGGNGSPAHLTGALFAKRAGIKLTHVPYRGTGPAITDLVGGHITIMFSPLPPTIGYIKDGTLRALAVSDAVRSSVFPEIPTIAESALSEFESTQRYGIVAPSGTPAAVIAKLNAALRDALALDDVKVRIAADGAEPAPGSPEDYRIDIEREQVKWSTIVKQL
jgi:tripartite-type tricarboxylate transporter receptor subunit TctC